MRCRLCTSTFRHGRLGVGRLCAANYATALLGTSGEKKLEKQTVFEQFLK